MQPRDLDAHLGAKIGIEIAERFVEQEHVGRAGDGAADGDALALAARQLARLALEQGFELQDRSRPPAPCPRPRPCRRRSS